MSLAVLALASAAAASAQVNLVASASPADAAPLLQTVTVQGSSFPAGTICNTCVSVTITPPAGNGSPVTVSSTQVATVIGTTRKVSFVIPASLLAAQPLANCQVSISGQTAANVQFSSANSSTLQIDPPASVLSVTPGAGTVGTNASVNVVGFFTHWNLLTPAVTLIGPGGSPTINATAGTVGVVDKTHLGATFAIPANATPGQYEIQIQTGAEIATLSNAFLVSVNPGLTLGPLVPSSGAAGTCFSVSVTGNNTSWTQNTTVATMGDGVTISGAETGFPNVSSTTALSLPVCIDPLAVLGPRTLTIATGGEYEVATNAFTVVANGATLQSVAPNTAPQATNQTITLTGVGTHWLAGATNVSFGGGINVGNITVLSSTSLQANISVGPGVAVGTYGVSVTTNGETVSLPGSFSVTLATPYLSGASPIDAPEGQPVNILVTGVLTHFLTGAFTANFGSDITVVNAHAITDTTANVNINISPTAFVGGRTVTITSNATNYSFLFTVDTAGAKVTSVTPPSGFQGASVALQVTGVNTHWAQGLTFASLGGLTVNRVVVNSATTAEVDITIPQTAVTGNYSISMSTNGEIASLSPAFTVLPYTPTLTISPSSGMIGTTVNVSLNGNLTHFANLASAGPTELNIDGQGVTIQNFQILGPTSATAQFVIDQTAPASPADVCANIYGGNRIVTLTTPLASSAEIVNAGFCVTSTPAVLTSITPYHSAEPASFLSITITGQYTHFVQGTTAVSFGPNITVVPGSVSVSSSTVVSCQIMIPANAPIGWLPVFVNTGTEQLTIGFAIDAPASASLVSVTPGSAIQGQSTSVNITGNLTNWLQGSTEAILGQGITVNSLTVNSLQSATAQISVDATTPAGGRTVSMITPIGASEEVVSGPLFSVTAGVATISQVGCGAQNANYAGITLTNAACNVSNNGIPQGDIVTFVMQGSQTHWLQGETTFDFGSGITTSNVNIVSPTLAYCQITVSYSAALGFRQVTATTVGEVAPSFTDAINIVPSQGTGVNITPSSAPQGNTITMQVNGIATHFTANNTVASFGNNNGVNVTNVSVVNPTQMNLTVQVLGTAGIGPYTLTVTTTGLPVPPNPQSTEQLTLPNSFSVSPGAAIITNVAPTTGAQGSTASLQVTGQNTSWVTGVTTAYLSSGGCTPPISAGVNVSNVTASSNTSAVLAIAISPTAPTGYQTLCMYTGGETVAYGNAFKVTPGTPTLNSVTSPTSGANAQQGQTITDVAITGQFTHWTQGTTTVTFGQGINLVSLTITSATTATASIAVDPLAYTGSRVVTMTTGTEIVSGNFYHITSGPAIISIISPSTGNQGQHILMTITGEFTHWSQSLTQFSITGGGYDITVNGVVINTPTSALADLTISGTASLGTRTIFMSTEGENVALSQGFLVTGGIPSIINVSPSYGTRGDTADTITITGAFTNWTSASLVDFGDPAIIVSNLVNESSTSEGMVISIGAGATLGIHTVTVRTGGQALTAQFNVLNPAAPPVPYISYMTPSVGLSNPSQTLQVYLYGAYTKWNPGPDQPITSVTFGAGIQVNSFQVTGLTSATANITVEPGATTGPRTVTMTTGAEVETTTFYVTVGTPVISLVDPSTAIQGETRDIDLVGQYTTWQQGVTNFAFCNGIIINSTTVFGPNAARVNVTIPILQPLGGCGVVATTNAEVAGNIASFSINPSEAIITQVTPNTAMQGTQNFVVNVTGFATHWDNTTNFSFGSGSVGIAQVQINSNTSATLTLDLAPLASPGYYTLTATTAGEVARLNNAFVVQPGTPILLSSTPGQFQQQGQFSIGILGQFTSFVAGWPAAGSTSVQFSGLGANITGINVTGPQSITVLGNVSALAYPGCFNIVVTTGNQVLTLYSAFCITYGPAAITNLTPNNGGTGQTNLSIAITGTNTNWVQGTTIGTFGAGISLNSLQVNSHTSATANITIAANATAEANTVTLTTAGEVASDPASFTIFAATPVLDIVTPSSGAQNTTTTSVNITSSFTHFDITNSGLTTADFGPGITAAVNVTSSTTATALLNISPIAALTTRTVRMITCLANPCSTQEIAVKASAFTVTAGNASISSATPTSPASVHQNDSGDQITIVGLNTHFTQAAIGNANVVFCSGVSTAAVVVQDDHTIFATVNVSQNAPTGACGVTVTTGGEVAAGSNLFNVLPGIAKITQISPNSAHQGDQSVQITVTGLYTHFTSGALTISIPGATLVGSVTPNNDLSATGTFNFSTSAATGVESISVSDTTDGALNLVNSFTVNAGVPALLSLTPNTMGQGITQTITIAGAFTHFSTSSVVTISGTLVTTGAIVSATTTSLQIPFTVAAGAAAGTRTVTVTTGAEVVQLASNASGAFTVQPGVPNITNVSPNIGVPNSTVPVIISGIFTNWVQGTTAVQVGSAGSGITVSISSVSATQINANFIIASGTVSQAYTVTVTTGPQILQATSAFTVQSSTTTPPAVTFMSPTPSSTGAPINTLVTVTFSEPLNPATVPTNGANAFLVDNTTTGQSCNANSIYATAGTVAMDVSGRVMTLTATPLAIGHVYYLNLNNTGLPAGTPLITDQSSNALARYCQSFTTGLTSDNSGPTFISGNIAAGSTNIPTNMPALVLGFNKAIDPATQAAGLSVTQAGNPVAGVWSYNTTFTQSIFTPTSTWTGSTAYLVTYTNAVQGTTGIALTNPGSFSFTTAPGTDTVSGQYSTWTPPYGSIGTPTTGTNPTIRFIYNKPVNPLSVTPANFYVYSTVNNATVLGTAVSWSADYKTFTLTLPGNLLPGTQYRWYLSGATDWLGNSMQTGSVYFVTSNGPDTTAPSVQTISPAATIVCGASPCAPVNAKVELQFTKLMDPTSLNAGTVTLTPTAPPGPSVTGTFSFSPDSSCGTRPDSSAQCNYTLLTFTPSSNLAANTTYTLSVPDGGLQDLNGNFDPFSSSFTTGSSSTPDTTHGTISSLTPSSGATNIPLNTNVVFQLNKAVDPLTLNHSSIRIIDNTIGVDLPGAIQVSVNYQTITFVPTAPLEPNHQICVYGSYTQSFFDLAGNYFNSNNDCFTTGTGTDTTAPTILSVSPTNGTTGIGPNNPVIVTFSKSINPGTLTNNVAIYYGSTLLTSSASHSLDGTSITFTGTGNLAWNTTFTVVVNPNVADLEGNPLGTEFSSTFATAPQPVIVSPSVTAMRPAAGATGVNASDPITLFMSAPMAAASINSSSLVISQNGVVITGNVAVGASNQDVTFTPTGGSFAAGAIIQAFFTNAATDANGNPLMNFQAQFTVAPSLTTVAPTVLTCKNGCTTDASGAIEYLFSKPLNPATVNGTTFFVKNGSNNVLLTGTTSLLDGGRLLRFQPSIGLPPNTCAVAYAYLTPGILDTTGLSFAGNNSSYYGYWCTNSVSNPTSPSVASTAPTGGATGIGTNSLISLTFSENVDQNTLDPSNVTLAGPGGNIPLTISYNSTSFVATVTPQAPLPPSGAITLTLNGVTDNDGHSVSPTPYTLTFHTGAAPDFNPPVLISSNIAANQTNVPVTSNVTLTFNKPIDLRSVILSNTLYFQDATLGYPTVPASVTPLGSNELLLVPTSPLEVGHQYRVYFTSISDLNGNLSTTASFYFTTVLAAPSGGPVVTQIIPLNGSNPPLNFSPMVQFDRPVAPTSLSSVTLMQGANPVPATAALSAGGTVLTLIPNSLLSPTLPYTFTVAGVQDSSGNVMSAPVSRSFITGPAIELTAPVVTVASPIASTTTATNPELLILFGEQINPITSSSFSFYNQNTNGNVNGAVLNWAADYKSVQITYPGTLSPGSRYYFYMSSVCNLAGNCASSGGTTFYTGTSADNTPESVTTVNPPAGATGVPLNPAITLMLAKPAARGTLTNSSITLSPAVAGTTVSVSADGYTLTLNLNSVNLQTSTLYTINVAHGAFIDEDGNPVAAFSSTFTTGTSAEASGFHGTISLTNPPPGTAGVALNSAITVTFSQPLDPNSLTGNYFAVYQYLGGSYLPIAGTITYQPSPANTLTFTPAVALPPNATIELYVGYNSPYILDYAGNYFNALQGTANATFATANTADNTPPQVISMTPGPGATNVGPYAPVSVTFNKSISSSTINTANFAIYYGTTLTATNFTVSSDERTVTFSTGALPYSTAFQVAINTGVKDLAGNNMATSYTAGFTTQATGLTAAASVIQARPGNGAALTSPITLFMSAPLNLSTVQAGMYVAQNGVLVSGTAALTADLKGITWTPSVPYAAGALIEAYLTTAVTDTTGNPVTNYKLSFTTQAAVGTVPTEASLYPCRNCGLSFTNPVIEVVFSKPLNPATVTSSTFKVTAGSPSGAAVAGTLSLSVNNTLARFTPTSPLTPSTYVYVTLTTGIQDVSADPFAGDVYFVYTNPGSTLDNNPPAVQAVTPLASSTGIGDNAPVRLVFNKLVDTNTINPVTVQLLKGATQLPYTLTFTTTNGSTQTVATLLPQAPLPDSSNVTIQIVGVSDLTGAIIASTSPVFTTLAGADFTSPTVIQQSIDSHNNANVGTNATFTWVFNKPLDPSTVLNTTSGFYVYDSACTPTCTPPVTVHVSADLRTVTIVPNGALSANATNDHFYANNATDLNGNVQTNTSQVFTTASGTDVAGPAIVATNPLSTNSNPVPTNAAIEVIFSGPVSGASLGNVTLTGGANGPYSVVLNNSVYTDDTVVRIVPQSLLLPNTAYTVNVSGVTDTTGNPAGTTSFSFTTGPGFQAAGLNESLDTATITTGSGTVALPPSTTIPNVLDSPTIKLVYDHAIDYATLLHGAIALRNSGNTIITSPALIFQLSPDQKTVTITTASPLAAGTTYRISSGYSVTAYDISGNADTSNQDYTFTTQ